MNNVIDLSKLKSIRMSMRISQEEMARSIKISLRSYQMKESGKNEFLFKEIVAIAFKFNMSIYDLLKEIMYEPNT
jgi:DNA-binding XRE family transcriptional regulator